MNDRLIMENYLLILKSTVEVFVHGTLESSNEDVRTLLKSSLSDIMSSQAHTYDIMVSCGWYMKENVQKTNIEKTLNKVSNSN